MSKFSRLELPVKRSQPVDVSPAVEIATTMVTPVGMLVAMEDSTGDLHAIGQRLSEIVPFLKPAIKVAKGDVRSFLIDLQEAL